MPTPPETDCPDDLAPARPECGGGAAPLAVHPKVFRDELAAAADWVASYLLGVGQRPVTRPMPPAHRQAMATASLPQDGQDLGSLLEFVDRAIAPYPTGNGHPAFFAWINSPPSPAGVIAELLATAVNATCGMGEHALMDLERGVLRDLASLAGLAPTAGGVLTSGGSMANLLCLGAARTRFLRQQGATDGPAYDQAHARLVAYHSDQAHMSVAKAAAVIGLPPWRLRAVPTTPDRSMDVDALRTMVDADRAAGLLPFCVVSNLGSTATGAIDPIEAITRVCHRAGGLWHHGDGAWGGLGTLVPELAPSYRGIAGLDSLTVDPHKALSVPVGCGAALVTDPSRLRDAFTFRASYLEGDQDWPWMSDYTVELTRPGTRALTLWATLRHLGRSGVVALLQHYQDLARYLRHRVQENPLLELCTSGPLPVVCFRLASGPETRRQGREDLHTAVAARVQARGHAYLATVSHDRQTVLRACVCNHLTTTDDVDTLLHEVLAAADHLQTVQ